MSKDDFHTSVPLPENPGALAVAGGTPVRTAPLPTGFFGMRLVGDEEKAEALAVLEGRALSRVSGMTPPTRVATFERELCRQLGSRYALGVTSGTAALEVALAAAGIGAAGIGPGDEVIMPALNFISSPETVLRLGAIPIFAEVDEGFGLDPDDIESRITPRTRAIMPVHVHGAACRIDAIVEVARRHGLRVIENGAWSLGAQFQGQSICTFGDLGIHSLQSVKVITAGEGGVVHTADPLLYERAARYHNHGNLHIQRIPDSLADAPVEPADPNAGSAPASEPFLGAAYRMPELSGAVALAQTRKLPEVLARTRRAQRAILEGLRAVRERTRGDRVPFALRAVPDPEGDCGIAVGLLLPDAERATAWQSALAAEGVRMGPLYGGRPVYALPQLRDLRPAWTNGAPLAGGLAGPYTGSLCPRTESLMARSLVLSVTPDYTAEDARDVVLAVHKVATALS